MDPGNRRSDHLSMTYGAPAWDETPGAVGGQRDRVTGLADREGVLGRVRRLLTADVPLSVAVLVNVPMRHLPQRARTCHMQSQPPT